MAAGIRDVGRFLVFIVGGIVAIIVGAFMIRGTMHMWDDKPDGCGEGGEGGRRGQGGDQSEGREGDGGGGRGGGPGGGPRQGTDRKKGNG